MSDTPARVLVKDTDMLSAKSLIELLQDSINGMKKQVAESKELTDANKIAIIGAVKALTDLYNLVLAQLQEVRNTEVFEDDGGHGGKFDA